MKKVYQTIIDSNKGNCFQATTASLLDLELTDVPNFIEFGEDYFWEYYVFMRDNFNKEPTIYFGGKGDPSFKDVLKIDGGINGYFQASVKSQTFEDALHSVIVDVELNIIHDPNPNQKALLLDPSDIINVITYNNLWYIQDGKVIKLSCESS